KAKLKLQKATFHKTISSSLRRHRKGKNSMVLTSSCSRSICSQALPVVFLSYFVYGSSVCRECVWPVGP
ncbi:Os06g0294950, partial [Oryza sativa Japonica Group]